MKVEKERELILVEEEDGGWGISGQLCKVRSMPTIFHI